MPPEKDSICFNAPEDLQFAMMSKESSNILDEMNKAIENQSTSVLGAKSDQQKSDKDFVSSILAEEKYHENKSINDFNQSKGNLITSVIDSKSDQLTSDSSRATEKTHEAENSNFRINESNTLVIESKSAQLTMDNSRAAENNLNNQNSKFSINESNTLVLESNMDKFKSEKEFDCSTQLREENQNDKNSNIINDSYT